jgi:hypothetical protein
MKKILLFFAVLMIGVAANAQLSIRVVNQRVEWNEFGKENQSGSIYTLLFHIQPILPQDMSLAVIKIGQYVYNYAPTNVSINGVACTSFNDLVAKVSAISVAGGVGSGGSVTMDSLQSRKFVSVDNFITFDSLQSRGFTNIKNWNSFDSTKTRSTVLVANQLDSTKYRKFISVDNFVPFDSLNTRGFLSIRNFPDSGNSRAFTNINNWTAFDSTRTRKVTSIDNYPSIGTAAAGTAAATSTLTGLQYNVTSPTPTNGQQVALQGDASGQLRVNAMIGGNDYKLSVVNSSAVQLAAAATFTGAIESALGFPQLLVSIRANQNTTITIRQYKDAAGAVELFDFTGLPLTYVIPLNAGFNRQISVVGSYYRVVVTNNGGAATTNFDLETWTGNFPPTPNLTLRGNLPTANNEINGTATSVNAGNADAGTQRVVLASNQAAIPINKNVTGGTTDVASAAITVTGISPTITPTSGVSYSVIIAVTAVTGTSPTMSVTIEESYDAGTTWYPVFVFPTIIANGVYRSPALPFRGTRIRYNQTLSGTTPSFTRSIVRMQSNDDVNLAYRVVSSVVNGTITTGGTSQILAAANEARQKFMIVNNSATELWFNFISAAGVNIGHKLAAGQSFCEPAGVTNVAQINIFGATTGQQYSFQQW